MSAKTRRTASRVVGAHTAPVFDPAAFMLKPRHDWDSWTVTAAAVLYLTTHGIANGASYDAARRVGSLWLAQRQPASL